jgi:hypothetical protein
VSSLNAENPALRLELGQVTYPPQGEVPGACTETPKFFCRFAACKIVPTPDAYSWLLTDKGSA